jgi:hypothetical protein
LGEHFPLFGGGGGGQMENNPLQKGQEQKTTTTNYKHFQPSFHYLNYCCWFELCHEWKKSH